MDQELKQRLIGAAVITALAAIFVPMLFDDPIDDTGKNVSELKIPEIPEKAQDVEIMPLPEKADDVLASQAPHHASAFVEEGAESEELPKTKQRLANKEKTLPARRLQAADVAPADAVADEEPVPAEADDAPPPPVLKPAKLPATTSASALPATSLPPAKALKPVGKPLETAAVEAPAKQAAGNEAATRWYLNAGSFGQRANAQALQENLKQQGFAASIKEVSNDKGTVFKVRIGPMLDKLKAQEVKNKLAQININSFVSPDE